MNFLEFLIFLTLVNGYNNGVGRLPYMGWNTWCTGGRCERDICNAQEIKEIANAMVTNGMFNAGYRYINLDDCWLACERLKNGSLHGDPERFPNGMASIIAYVHNLNSELKFGLYTDVGTHTCSGGGRPCSPPGLYGHYQSDAMTLADWKVDFIKLDNCHKPSNESWQTLHTQVSVALNNSGRAILLELDGGYSLEPPPSYPPSIAQAWKICPDHHDNWDSTINIIQYIRKSNNTQMSGAYAWAYNDFLMTGGEGCIDQTLEEYNHCPGQTNTEYMTEFAIFAISGSPLLVATDIRSMTDIMKKVLLNTEIIAVNQQNQTPVGNYLYTYDCNTNMTDGCQIWSRKLSVSNTIAVMLLNIDQEKHNITVNFDKLNMEWNANSKVMIRDLWEHQDVGNFIGAFECEVERHGNFFGYFDSSNMI